MYNRQSWNQRINLTSQNDDTDAIVTSAIYPPGVIPLNGALTSNGNYVNGTPAFLSVTSDADDSVTKITIIFKDLAGRLYIYTFAGPDTETIVIEIPVYQLLMGQLTIATASVGNLSFGVSQQTATVWVPFDQNRTQFNDAIVVEASSAADLTYTVEYTNEDALRTIPTVIIPDQDLVNIAVVNGSPAQETTALPYSVLFARVRISAWTDGTLINEFTTTGAYGSWKNY